jgi:glycosyltransferase involved in cell wall biosynthesis
MNVLLCISGLNGVTYHRLLAPYLDLQRKGLINVLLMVNQIKEVNKDDYPHYLLSEKYELDENKNIKETKYVIDLIHTLDDNLLREADVLVFNRNISPTMKPEFVFQRLAKFGVRTICDMDDSAKLNSKHVLSAVYRKTNTESCIIANCMMSSAITVTTPHLKKDVAKQVGVKKNISIVKNAIDLNDTQWNVERRKIAEKDPVFGWAGSVTHEIDLKVAAKGYDLCKTKPKVALSGVALGDPVWDRIASMFPNAEYYPPLEVKEYASTMDSFDVFMIPLADNAFNRNKSELKMLEAAALGIPVIVSNVYPYKNLAKGGENCLLANNTPESWASAIDLMANSYELRAELAENLIKDVNKAYNLDVENEKRLNLLKSLCTLKD